MKNELKTKQDQGFKRTQEIFHIDRIAHRRSHYSYPILTQIGWFYWAILGIPVIMEYSAPCGIMAELQLLLALLSQEIIHLAIIGALPEHVSLATLRVGLPADWEEQKKFLRME